MPASSSAAPVPALELVDSHSHFEAQDFLEHGGKPGAGWLARYLRARSPAPGPLGTVICDSVPAH